MEIACPRCAARVPPDRSFCGECGSILQATATGPTEAPDRRGSYTPRFLANKVLTTPGSIEGERKVVTVLFADVVNFTGISERVDPEMVHEIMNGCFEILGDHVHRYGGTINQFTGDGVMALFGAPVAQEDHAQRACYAALSIRDAVRQYGSKLQDAFGLDFMMRMGLNSGPVIVGSIGDDLRRDYTAQGDTTNLAARMQGIATPGAILVSGHTLRFVRDFFEFKPLGRHSIKGKEKPQDAYELIRPTRMEKRIEAVAARGLTRFVGRRKEVQFLREAFESARSGSGQVVGIVGEAGMGKSRLVLEVRGMLPVGEYTWLEGSCLHHGRAMAYVPILDILRSYFRIEEEDREIDIKKKLQGKVRDLCEKEPSVLPALHDLLSLVVDDKKYAQLGPQQTKERCFEAIRDLLIWESGREPLVLVLEDLHWTDRTSQEFLDYLIGWLPYTRILLILVYRPEYVHNWENKSYYTKVGLNQLSTHSSAELVQAVLKEGEVDPELMKFIIGKAGGNPLFVEELTSSMLESGSILKKGRRYALTRKGSGIEVPDSILDIIAARLDRMDSRFKQTLQLASVIGLEFPHRLLSAITEERESLKEHLLSLQRSEFIYETRLFPELEYTFKHALIQEVAYKSILRAKRMEIHERIGKAIESLYKDRLEEYYELLAYHFTQSRCSKKAVEYLDLANQKSARAGAPEQAKAYFDDAMKLLDTLPGTPENRERRTALLVNQSIVYELLFQWNEYYDLMARHLPDAEHVQSPGLLAAFYNRIAGCEWSFGLFDKAIEKANRVIELVHAAGSQREWAHALLVYEVSYLWKGDFPRAIAYKEEILRRLEKEPNIYLSGRAMCMAAMAYSFLGRWGQALKEGTNAMESAREFSDNSQICSSASSISVCYNFRGDPVRAVEYGELAVEKASTPMDRGWAEACLGWAWSRNGDPKRGIEVLAPFVEIVQSARYLTGAFPSMFWLGEAYLLAGEYSKAREVLEALLSLSDRCGARHYIGLADYMLAEIALKTEPARVPAHLDRALAVFRETQAGNDSALACECYGRYCRQQGRHSEARRWLGEALGIFERLGTHREQERVREEVTTMA
jgi:class 3 adenylate cyclase/tetratricopeptide (TPR) repeat protein